MGFALRSDGSTGYVSIDLPVAAFTSTVSWSVEWKGRSVSAVQDAYIFGRAADFDNYIRVTSAGTVGVKVGGDLLQWPSAVADHTVNHKYKVVAFWAGSGDKTFELFVDDVSQGSLTSTQSRFFAIDQLFKAGASTFGHVELEYLHYIDNNNASNTRLYDARSTSSGTTLPETVNAVNGTLNGTLTWENLGGADSITLSDFIADRVYQRSGLNRVMGIAGTFVGVPTSVEARIVNQVGGATVVDWTVVDAAPSGGSFSGTLAVPNGGPYLCHVRFSNDVGVTSEGANGFLVGDVFVAAGQSNIEFWFSDSGADSPDTKVRVYNDAGAWEVPGAADRGAIAFANKLVTDSGVPVALLDCGLGGSSLRQEAVQGGGYWITSGLGKGTNYTNTLQPALSNSGNEIAGLIWSQGETEAKFGGLVTQQQYQDALEALIAFVRADVSDAALPVALVYTGKYVGEADADAELVREAQRAVVTADANVYGVTAIDLGLRDLVHFTDHAPMAQRCAQVFAYLNGDQTYYRGPQIASAALVNSTTVDVTISHSGGSDFTPVSGITGLEVLDDGTPVTVSAAVRQDATTIRLTLAAAIVGTPTLRYLYGADPTVTGAVADNSALALPMDSAVGVGVVISSTLSIAITGIPDGAKKTILINPTDDSVVFASNVTYAAGSGSAVVGVVPGTVLKGLVDDGGAPPTDGAVIYGTTA